MASLDFSSGSEGAPPSKDSGPDRVTPGSSFLRPQTLASILRNTARIYLQNWATICLIYVLPLFPLGMLRITATAYGHIGLATTFNLLQSFGYVLVGAALTVAVSDICIGRKPSLRRAFGAGSQTGIWSVLISWEAS